MELREEIRELVAEELKAYVKEELTKKDFIQAARLIRNHGSAPALVDFFVQFAKEQNPRFDEARFREAVKSGKGI